MDLSQRVPKSRSRHHVPELPVHHEEEKGRRRKSKFGRWGFFAKTVRIGGEGGLSMPVGLVLLFPIFIIVMIIMMFTRQPNSRGMFLMPGGAAPAIRFVNTIFLEDFPAREEVVLILGIGRLAKSTTRSSSRGVRSRIHHSRAPTLRL